MFVEQPLASPRSPNYDNNNNNMEDNENDNNHNHCKDNHNKEDYNKYNTKLLSIILVFGNFLFSLANIRTL